jgi:YHS domain-containing protein
MSTPSHSHPDGHAGCSTHTADSGAKAVDPVCGMTVDPATAAHRAAHEGRDYFFCSAGCRTKFVAEPDRYLGEKPQPAPVVPGAIYTCPMHPDVTSDKSGKCPKCGMDLKAEDKTAQTYSCPNHPEMTSDKPGKCSKCGASLALSPKEKMKMEVMKIYTCPMHSDVTSDKPGKCPKCGMDMKEKN